MASMPRHAKDYPAYASTPFGESIKSALTAAAADYRYLLDRGYPRSASLELVGNRYNLDRISRQILHRGVFAAKICEQRKAHRETPESIAGEALAVDGYNVLITVEASLSGIPVLVCDDGWVRDVAEVSGGYRFGPRGMRAMEMILTALRALGPCRVHFFFDSPIAYSGQLASLVRMEMEQYELAGEALAVPVPERIIQEHEGPVATSDSALIDRLPRVVDLAGHVIRRNKECGVLLKLF
jgi:hypothetical protein